MIELRRSPAVVEHGRVRMVALDTTVSITTKWFTLAAGYRRPQRVEGPGGSAATIRDHTMIVRVATATLVFVLIKGVHR